MTLDVHILSILGNGKIGHIKQILLSDLKENFSFFTKPYKVFLFLYRKPIIKITWIIFIWRHQSFRLFSKEAFIIARQCFLDVYIEIDKHRDTIVHTPETNTPNINGDNVLLIG